MNFKSSGKLVYNPKTHLQSNNNWNKWLILMCDEELSQYYRWMFNREYPYLPKLMRPVWGTHISVIRGEVIPNVDIWGLGKDTIVQFEYESGVKDNGEYYWLKAHCDELAGLREAYGLPRQPKFGFHLTIGRTTYES